MTATTTRPDARAQYDGNDILFTGAGEMRALCRALDWTATPLGAPAQWSQSLRTTVDMLLACRNPMFLWWGRELVQLYNDAYRPSLGMGDRHPRALGATGREFWTEIWEVIGPQIDQVMTTGESTWHEDQYLPIERNGRLDDVWWTYSYSPVRDDDGSIQGTLVVCQETTPRVLAALERERLLADTARAERRAARVLEQVSDEHLTMDADFRILTLNPAAERALGVTREAIVGRTHWETFPASVGTEVERQYRRVATERVEVHFTHHYVGEGYDRHLEIDAYPTDEGGVAVFWRDVSERVRGAAALRESAAQYRALFESLDEGFCVIEVLFDDAGAPEDYRYVEANRAFERLTGLVDVIGKRSAEVIQPVDMKRVATYARVALTGEPVRFEMHVEGLQRWYNISAFRVRDPEDRRVAILFDDVTTARVAADERERLVRALEVERSRLAYAFQHAPSFFAVLRGAEHVFELVNDAYYRLVGQRELLGQSLLDALPEVRGQGFPELLDHVLATGEVYTGRELPLLLARTPGAAPEQRFVDFVYMPLLEGDGTRAGVIAHGTDVTEQVQARIDVERLLAESERARAEAEAARADAEMANRAKGEFLAVMSHELRTPLNAIGGYAELLEMGLRGPVTEHQRADLARIQQSQRHLLGLINQVLNYTRIETGTVRYEMSDVPVGEALAAAEALVVPQVRAKGLTYVLGGCDPSLHVRADREKLQQILLNLLTNAIKFTDSGGEIRVACGPAQPAGVEIVVADTGVGVPPDKLALIFEPFVQVDQRLTRAHEGVGLGLAISRDLARGMGGDLTAESVSGVGSTFTLRLAVAKPIP